jgi:hypothetical protein
MSVLKHFLETTNQHVHMTDISMHAFGLLLLLLLLLFFFFIVVIVVIVVIAATVTLSGAPSELHGTNSLGDKSGNEETPRKRSIVAAMGTSLQALMSRVGHRRGAGSGHESRETDKWASTRSRWLTNYTVQQDGQPRSPTLRKLATLTRQPTQTAEEALLSADSVAAAVAAAAIAKQSGATIVKTNTRLQRTALLQAAAEQVIVLLQLAFSAFCESYCYKWLMVSAHAIHLKPALDASVAKDVSVLEANLDRCMAHGYQRPGCMHCVSLCFHGLCCDANTCKSCCGVAPS